MPNIKTIKRATLTVFLFLSFTGCDVYSPKPRTYNDCLLSKSGDIINLYALKAIKIACKQKFPIKFNFNEIAKKSNVDLWSEVIKKKEYTSLTDEIKKEVKAQYFTAVIKPRVHPDFIAEAKTQFDSYSLGLKRGIINTSKTIDGNT
ncbi:MAG: hypothetical protein R8M45_05845 [Ghiorsea sp.]